MLTRFIRNQLIVFAALTLAALIALGWFYLRIPSQLGVGQYRLVEELPASGGLYRTSNVTYRGIQIGKVTKVEPTEHGVRATLSIDDRYKIPIDASADVHSVSAIGEQYVDLVSTGDPGKFFSPGQTITKGTVPSEIGPALDAANRGLSVLPKHKIASLLNETSLAVGGLGPALQRLVDSTQSIVGDFEANISDVDDIIGNAAPILDSQVDSGDSIAQWSRNLKVLTAQMRTTTHTCRACCRRAHRPPAGQQCLQRRPRVAAGDHRQPRSRRRHAQALQRGPRAVVGVSAGGRIGGPDVDRVGAGGCADESQSVTEQSTAVPDRVPAGIAVAVARRHQRGAAAVRNISKIPQDTQANDVRGARNYPCVDVPGKRRATHGNAATTSRTCRWAPTPGTAIRTRSATARHRARAAINPSTPAR